MKPGETCDHCQVEYEEDMIGLGRPWMLMMTGQYADGEPMIELLCRDCADAFVIF
jgi:hypothetical protein